MNRFSVVACLALAMTLVTTQSAFAARVYNFLPTKVYVTGLLGGLGIHQITLVKDERSDSIGWSSANVVRVDQVTQMAWSQHAIPLCTLNFGVHAEIQGGNYMTIGHHGSEVVCTVCNSSHDVVSRSAERSNYNWTGDSRTGC